MSELTKLFFPFFNLHLHDRLEPYLKEDYLRFDRFMLYLILLHWVTATVITSHAFDTVRFGFIVGALITLITLIVFIRYKGTRVFRITAALALIGFSALFIQQHLGRIELHFHVFVALAFLTIYKDYLPLLTAAAATILHHLLFNILQAADLYCCNMPLMIFSYGCGFEIVALHALFVIVETIILLYIVVLRQISFDKIIRTTDRLGYLNDNLEKEVAQKTEKLQQNVLALQRANYDLTEAKNRAVMANEARTNFVSSVSHELRTPLNSIINFTDMVIEDFDEMFENVATKEENREFLGRVLKNSKHLLALINDILEYTKAEAGKITLEMNRIDIIPLLSSAFTNCRGILGNTPIDYRIETPGEPLMAVVDKRRFFQILLNLISNAIKFTPDGFVVVRSYEKENRVFIEVEDSGRGIPKEKLEKIFHPFEQVTLDDAGTGLGLVIVQKLCENMNITLDVASVFGEGTTFTLTLEKADDETTH